MKNKMLAKCTADKNQLEDRRNRGAKYIEIHLRDSEPKNLHQIDEMVENIEKSGLKVLVIHAPMHRNYILESLGNSDAEDRLYLIGKMAEKLYKIQGEIITIVIHQELTLEQLIDFGLINRIKESLRVFMAEHSFLKIGIENLSILNTESGKIIARPNYLDGAVDTALYLRKELITDRIGTVLDTCHALNSVRVLKALRLYDFYSSLSMESFFEKYKDTLFLIHLSNARNLGFGRDHGQRFELESEVIEFRNIMRCIEDIEYLGPITLELTEKSPLKAESYTLFNQALKKELH